MENLRRLFLGEVLWKRNARSSPKTRVTGTMRKAVAALLLGFLASACQATCTSGKNGTTTSRIGLYQPAINECGWGDSTNTDWSIVDSSVACLSCNNSFTGSNSFASLSGTNLTISNTLNVNDIFPSNPNSSMSLELPSANPLIVGSYSSGSSMIFNQSCNNDCYSYQDAMTFGGPSGTGVHFLYQPSLTNIQNGTGDMVRNVFKANFLR